MKMYIVGTNKWTKVRIRKWNGRSYGEDFSNEILTDFNDGGEYTEQEIADVLEWCAEYCDENDCHMFVSDGED